jgi:hypothetical protein
MVTIELILAYKSDITSGFEKKTEEAAGIKYTRKPYSEYLL